MSPYSTRLLLLSNQSIVSSQQDKPTQEQQDEESWGDDDDDGSAVSSFWHYFSSLTRMTTTTMIMAFRNSLLLRMKSHILLPTVLTVFCLLLFLQNTWRFNCNGFRLTKSNALSASPQSVFTPDECFLPLFAPEMVWNWAWVGTSAHCGWTTTNWPWRQ